MKKTILNTLVVIYFIMASCTSQNYIDISPHEVNHVADVIYQEALKLSNYYDIDSTQKTLQLLDNALKIDSLNPDYYGMKAKLLSELGHLDSALTIQLLAKNRGAMTGEYLFQLGLFQAAKDQEDKAKQSFKQSNEYLKSVLDQYPDSLGAFILQRAAYALYMEQDSLFMPDISAVRDRFSDRLMEIEMTRRLKPHSLIKQLKKIEKESLFPTDSEMDKLIEEAIK